jgi:hypothetical protein
MTVSEARARQASDIILAIEQSPARKIAEVLRSVAA